MQLFLSVVDIPQSQSAGERDGEGGERGVRGRGGSGERGEGERGEGERGRGGGLK